MLCYAKLSANQDRNDILQLFIQNGATPEQCILDDTKIQKQEASIYHAVKESALKDGKLIIDRMESLGKNNREIYKELTWFASHNISLQILNLPSTLANPINPVDLLADVYSHLAEIEISHVKEQQKIGIAAVADQKKLGRKKIPYPKDWEYYFNQWQAGDIDIKTFMSLTGLKRGTLYNLIKEYTRTENSSQADKANA